MVIVEEGFIYEKETHLTVMKTSLFFSGDGFAVYDCNGQLVFRVDSYGPDIRDTGELVLMDPNGRCLLTVRRKVPIYAPLHLSILYALPFFSANRLYNKYVIKSLKNVHKKIIMFRKLLVKLFRFNNLILLIYRLAETESTSTLGRFFRREM